MFKARFGFCFSFWEIIFEFLLFRARVGYVRKISYEARGLGFWVTRNLLIFVGRVGDCSIVRVIV